MIDVVLFCLALNVYFEARSEPFEGQMAVAEVTLRRASLSGRNVCEEVFLDKQFSWTALLPRPLVINKSSWQQSLAIASQSFIKDTNYSKGATHFHSIRVKPKWARTLCKTTIIGQHIFYKPCEENK